MLNIVLNNEKFINFRNNNFEFSVEGYVLEVLHREFHNITDENILQYEQNGIDSLMHRLNQLRQQKQQQEIFNQQQQQQQQQYTTNTSHHIPINNATQILTQQTNSNNGNKQAATATVNNSRPQIIKLQSFPSTCNTTTVSSTVSNLITSSSPVTKPIIYLSQSPVKANKLIKFATAPSGGGGGGVGTNQLTQAQLLHLNGNLNQTQLQPCQATTGNLVFTTVDNAMVSAGKNGGQVLLLNDVKDEKMYINGHDIFEDKSVISLQQQQQQPHQYQDQQVLNLVVLTDSANGGVSYLSLVPQN